MPSMQFRSLRLTDRQLLTAFDEIRSVSPDDPQATVNINVGQGVQPIHVSLPRRAEPSEDVVETFLAAESAISVSFSMSLQQGVNVAVNRQTDGTGTDQCSIAYPDNWDAVRYTQLIAACHRHLQSLDRSDSLSRLLGPELRDFYTRREQTLLRLEGLTERLIQQNSEYRREVDRETTQLRERLQATADADREKVRHEQEAKDADLKAREATFDQRVKALDDRRATHARRGIRDDMKRRLEAREKDFTLTPKTVAKRLPIHWLFLLLIATPTALLCWGLWDVIAHASRWDATPYDWVRLLRLPLGAAGLVGFLVYYIRWNDRWFTQHAEEEFRLKRLDLDIDRASWMVEMMLEWKEEKDSPIPPELIDRLSRNLFAIESAKSAVQHPAQDITALLMQASSVTIPIPGGGQATLGAKGLRRLQKSAKGDEE